MSRSHLLFLGLALQGCVEPAHSAWDPLADEDHDGAVAAEDCDDTDPSVLPGGDEITGDGVDQDCDGVDRVVIRLSEVGVAVAGDDDGDTFGHLSRGGQDLDGDGLVDVAVGAPHFYQDTLATEAWVVTAVSRSARRAAFITGTAGTVHSTGVLEGPDGIWLLVSGSSSIMGVPAPLHEGVQVPDDAEIELTEANVVEVHPDLDGDGFQDVSFSGSAANTWTGEVYVHYTPLIEAGSATNADSLLVGAEEYGQFGETVASGDADGDGTPDLVVGASGEPNGSMMGVVYVFLGPLPARAHSTGAWATYAGVAEGGLVGTSIGGALRLEDLTGDGQADLLLPAIGGGPEDAGRYGGAVWLIDAPAEGTHELAVEVPHMIAEAAFSWLGNAAAVGPDLDGNGVPELLVSAASSYSVLPGAIYGFNLPVDPALFDTAHADYVLGGDTAGDATGQSLAAGDMDGDGGVDLLVGAPGVSTDQGDFVGAVTFVAAGAIGE